MRLEAWVGVGVGARARVRVGVRVRVRVEVRVRVRVRVSLRSRQLPPQRRNLGGAGALIRRGGRRCQLQCQLGPTRDLVRGRVGVRVRV